MESKKGIWIDSKKAVIVTLDKKEKQLKVLESGIETKPRVEGEGKKYTRMGTHVFPDEKNKERKLHEQTKKFMKELMHEIRGCSELVVFGPSTMKHELEKEIMSHKDFSAKLKSVENADSMTDKQVAAWVDEYYRK